MSSPASDASSPGGDASPRRHLLIKARCLDKQIQYIFLFSYCQVGVSNPTWQCRREDASPPSEDTSPKWGRVASVPIYIYAWNKRTYIYTREITPFMFFNTKHKKSSHLFVPSKQRAYFCLVTRSPRKKV